VKTRIGPSAQLAAVIIRACSCGHPREMGKPCAGCGSEKPPQVTDLGVIAAGYQSRWKRLKWKTWGYHAAQRRINRVNRDMLKNSLRSPEGCG
jgi:hypothetical protein